MQRPALMVYSGANMKPVSSWGRLGAEPHDVVELTDRSAVDRALTGGRPGIAHGLGRSYGDACLNPGGVLWHTTGLDRLIAFDPETGRLTCEAGVVLRDISRLMIPRGWNLAVVPGTQFVTVGGAIANDVHGKNHHVVGTLANMCAGCGWCAPPARRSTSGRTRTPSCSPRPSVASASPA